MKDKILKHEKEIKSMKNKSNQWTKSSKLNLSDRLDKDDSFAYKSIAYTGL